MAVIGIHRLHANLEIQLTDRDTDTTTIAHLKKMSCTQKPPPKGITIINEISTGHFLLHKTN